MDKDIPLWKLKQEASEYIAKCDAERGTGGLTMDKLIKCKDCRFVREKHYERDGEKPYIKAVCTNKFGLNNIYIVRADDFCSRAEPKEADDGKS